MSINNINNTNNPQLDPTKLGQQQVQNQSSGASNQAAGSQSAKPAQLDLVSLTQSAQQLSDVQRKGSEAPVNQEKSGSFEKAVADGEYKVNPEILANKIAVFESQMLGVKV